jgi:hypothetical protein
MLRLRELVRRRKSHIEQRAVTTELCSNPSIQTDWRDIERLTVSERQAYLV